MESNAGLKRRKHVVYTLPTSATLTNLQDLVNHFVKNDRVELSRGENCYTTSNNN